MAANDTERPVDLPQSRRLAFKLRGILLLGCAVLGEIHDVMMSRFAPFVHALFSEIVKIFLAVF